MLLCSAALAALTLNPPAVAPPPTASSPTAPAQLDLPAQRRPSRFATQRMGPSKRRGSRIMLGLGAGFFTGLYLGTTAIAATQLDDIHADGRVSGDERRTQLNSRLLFVPAIGPIVAAPFARSKGDTIAFVGMGLLQGMMISMMTISAVALARDARARRWDLGGVASREGARVSFRLRF